MRRTENVGSQTHASCREDSGTACNERGDAGAKVPNWQTRCEPPDIGQRCAYGMLVGVFFEIKYISSGAKPQGGVTLQFVSTGPRAP